MKRNRVFAILAVLIVAVVAVGSFVRERHAAAGTLPPLVSLVPTDAHFLLYADLVTLRDSPLVQRLVAMAPVGTVDRDYADFVAATGFNYQQDLDRVVIASREDKSSDQTIAFVEGRFNRGKIEQYALRSGKLGHENGRDVYLIPSATKGKTISVAFLSSDRIALTDGGQLSAAISAAAVPLDPPVRERLSRVAGAPLFAIAKTPATPGGTGANGKAGGFSASFQSLRWVSLAARPDGGTLLLSAEGECDGPNQAHNVTAGLELLRGLLRNGLGDPKARGKMSPDTAAAADKMLGSAQVTTDAARVRLLMTITPEMLPQATGSISSAGH